MRSRRFRKGRRATTPLAQLGQSMVEYAIIAAIVAVVALVAVRGLGTSISGLFGHVEQCVEAAQNTAANC